MSDERRWRPPPMESDPDKKKTPDEEKKINVDEQVVRKMLQVNPDVRAGRTTQQVKRDIERGKAISEATRKAVGGSGPVVAAGLPTESSKSVRTELEQTMSFFIRGKLESLRGRFAEIETARAELLRREEKIKMETRTQLILFLSMLDEVALENFGESSLEKHQELLRILNATPDQLLDAARKARE